jgi:hypothetical protein
MSLDQYHSSGVGRVQKISKPRLTQGNPPCTTVGRNPTVFRGIQVRKRGSSYAQVCTQLIQGNIPIDPDLLGTGDEKTGVTGGRFELSTSLSPAVDNSVNRR